MDFTIMKLAIRGSADELFYACKKVVLGFFSLLLVKLSFKFYNFLKFFSLAVKIKNCFLSKWLSRFQM
jgi:hypothetical protein